MCGGEVTANFYYLLPKRIQGEAKSVLHEIWRL